MKLFKKTYLFGFVVVIVIGYLVWFFTHEPIDMGNTVGGFRSLQSLGIEANVSPEEAYELAKPFLEKTFALRTKNRPEKMNFSSKTIDHVTLQGDWYYIVRENYPEKSVYFYLAHAVKVHKDTGEVIEPK